MKKITILATCAVLALLSACSTTGGVRSGIGVGGNSGAGGAKFGMALPL
jgi:hypothetical protein